MEIFEKIRNSYKKQTEEYSVNEFLELCKKDSSLYATAAERLLKSIGEPELIDTRKDVRLSRIFSNNIIKRYKYFEDFYGLEDVIDKIISYLKSSAQGLEEKKQILYLLGPVGSAKSSLAIRMKELLEKQPIYCLKYNDKMSPIFESPLGLFTVSEEIKKEISEKYSIPERYFPACMSPWLLKRLDESAGDINKFKVIKLYPSVQKQIAISKTEPGDDNNQDVSSLIGKTDISKLELFSQDDADAYSYSGALCKSNQGIMEFVEMFKAPIKSLNPLLTATQERNFKPTEGLSAIPFDGIILSHSNQAEWDAFCNDRKNEAFLDRVYIIKIPYSLQINEELDIYKKLLKNSSLKSSPCSPQTLDILAKFAVLTRIKEPENSSIYSKIKVYNGENLKETDPNAKSLVEYKEESEKFSEGMSGVSTRFSFKVLSKVFNFREEVSANPVDLIHILEKDIKSLSLPIESEDRYLIYLKKLKDDYVKFLSNEIQKAYVESYQEYGQNIFERYVVYAECWIDDIDYRDPETHQLWTRENLNTELEKIEKTAGIANPKEFRNEIVKFVLRFKAAHKGEMPKWNAYEKIKIVIEKRIFSNTEEMLPVISFSVKSNKQDEKKHKDFMKRMVDKGYTESQVKLLVQWYLQERNNN